MEYLDVVDSEGNKTGAVVSYEEAHRVGIMHRSVHVWIVNHKHEVLLQKRSATRAVYPNHWDISASGHVSSGESCVEAAKKEAFEEVGVAIRDEQLEHIGTLEEHKVLNGGAYISNEFQDVYVVFIDEVQSSISADLDEVSELKWVSVEKLAVMLQSNEESIVPHDEEYAMLISYLSKN